MGKGDKKSKRGKIFMGSYGKSRPRHKVKSTVSTRNNSKKASSKVTEALEAVAPIKAKRGRKKAV